MQQNIRIGILVVLIVSAIVSCTRTPSHSLVTDDLTFDKFNRTHGNIEFVRVDPDGAVVLQLQGTADTIIVRASVPTTLPNGTKAVVITSDPKLQTATVRGSFEVKGE